VDPVNCSEVVEHLQRVRGTDAAVGIVRGRMTVGS
jgi:hypothetical protein